MPCFAFLRRSAASLGALSIHGLRRGLHSCAASRLPFDLLGEFFGWVPDCGGDKLSTWLASPLGILIQRVDALHGT